MGQAEQGFVLRDPSRDFDAAHLLADVQVVEVDAVSAVPVLHERIGRREDRRTFALREQAVEYFPVQDSLGGLIAGAVAGGQAAAVEPAIGHRVRAGGHSQRAHELRAGGQAYVACERELTVRGQRAQFVQGADESPPSPVPLSQSRGCRVRGT